MVTQSPTAGYSGQIHRQLWHSRCMVDVDKDETGLPRRHLLWRGLEFEKRGRTAVIILIIILLLIFGGGGGYYGHSRWGAGGGAGIGLGTILVIVLICYLLGLFR